MITVHGGVCRVMGLDLILVTSDYIYSSQITLKSFI